MSLFSPYPQEQLPPDGRVTTKKEDTCDPYERNCATVLYVWESKCRSCYGTGKVNSSTRGRRGRHCMYTCVSCAGLGFVRRTSSRITPEVNGPEGPHFTIARPAGSAETAAPTAPQRKTNVWARLRRKPKEAEGEASSPPLAADGL